eukprot:scaffold2318_cov363-Pavlova_lutheri.AAC.13
MYSNGVSKGTGREKSVDARCCVGLVSLRGDPKSTATGTVGTHASHKRVEPDRALLTITIDPSQPEPTRRTRADNPGVSSTPFLSIEKKLPEEGDGRCRDGDGRARDAQRRLAGLRREDVRFAAWREGEDGTRA